MPSATPPRVCEMKWVVPTLSSLALGILELYFFQVAILSALEKIVIRYQVSERYKSLYVSTSDL